MSYEYLASGNSTASVPLGEYTAQILRGWPEGGARDRTELVQQGAVLVNGSVVAMQSDGTVNLSGASTSKRVGLVIRGNGDSSSAANSNGTFMSPQPLKSITALTWSAGSLTATVAGHAYVAGNIVDIAGTVSDANSTTLTGTYVITSVTTSTFSVAVAANPGVITLGTTTSQLKSASNNSGKAVVLWGNFIVATSNFAAGSYVPGSPVTAVSGQYALGNGTTDPEVGFVLRVQGASGTTPAYLVVAVY
jgi:hypothetical protein